MALTAKDAKAKYGGAQTLRTPLEQDWKTATAYCLPSEYAAWQTAGAGPVGATKQGSEIKRFAYDQTGASALPKYVAILQRLMTPDGVYWHKVTNNNKDLMKIYKVRQYYDDLNRLLFQWRYNPYAGFVQGATESYQNLGLYGSGPIRVTWRKAKPWMAAGLAYKAAPMRDFYVLTDENGAVYMSFLRYWLTPADFKAKWPDETPPKGIATLFAQGGSAVNTTYFEFVHIVYARGDDEYDQYALDSKRFSHCSLHLAVQDEVYIGKEGGFNGNPYLWPRTASSAGSGYGLSPAVRGLPALGTASATKKTVLKQGQKAVDPPILANDDGVLSGKVDQRPGRVIYGGINGAGQQLVKALDMGSHFQVAETILQDERADIKDVFHVGLFSIIEENPDISTPALFQAIVQHVSIIAPTMGRLQTDFLGPLVEREIRVIAEHAPHVLPQMPQEIIDANGEYTLQYTSPAAKLIYAEEDAGFTSLLSLAMEYAQQTGDPSALDEFALQRALPDMAEHKAVPVHWMATDEEKTAKKTGRQQDTQNQNLVQAAPALASITNAAMKTGGGSPAVKGIQS